MRAISGSALDPAGDGPRARHRSQRLDERQAARHGRGRRCGGAHRAPVDWSVLAFADRVIAVKSQDDSRSSLAVVDDLLRLRGQGTTDLAGALTAAARQLDRSRAKRRVTILMSDCRATTGADAIPVARGLDELCVIAPTDGADDAADFAKAVGAQLATVDEPTDIPAAFLKVLER